MYLSQSGLVGPGSAGLTHSGLVSKYLSGQTTPAWSVGFDSVYATEDPSAPPDVLGPEGIGARRQLLGHGDVPADVQRARIMSGAPEASRDAAGAPTSWIVSP